MEVAKTIETIEEQRKLIGQLTENAIPLENSDIQQAITLFEQAWEVASTHSLHDELVKLVPHLAKLYFHAGDWQKTLSFNMEALALGDRLNDSLLVARSCMAAAFIQDNLEQYVQSLMLLQRGVLAAEVAGHPEVLSSMLNNMGTVYKKLYRMGESLECYTRALRIAEESNLPDNERSACHNLAAYYMSNGDYKHFLEYSQRSLELSDQLNDQGSRANIIINLGTYYAEQDDMDNALKCYIEGVEILEHTTVRRKALAMAMLNAADIYEKKRELDNAHLFFSRTNEYSKQNGLMETLFKSTWRLAVLSLLQERPEDAERYKKEAQELTSSIDSETLLNDGKDYEFRYLLVQQKYEQAANVIYDAYISSREAFNARLSEQVAHLQVQFEMERKEHEAELYRLRSVDLEAKNLELEEANKKLQLAQEEIRTLERRNSIYAMAVTANHEMNQPLMIIHGNLEMLEKELDNTNPSKVRHMERIKQALQRIEVLLAKYKHAEFSRLGQYSPDTPMVFFDDENEK